VSSSKIALQSTAALKFVDTGIFTLRYFMRCMQCSFCGDGCCQYGCDVNVGERDRILAHAEQLQPFVSGPQSEWFTTDEQVDLEYPTGRFVRARTFNGACTFRSPNGRGCGIHAWALSTGRDYHTIKPMVCWLFPVCWDQGVLRPSSDVQDDLVCAGQGATLYEGTRDELAVVFGAALVAELDRVRDSLSA